MDLCPCELAQVAVSSLYMLKPSGLLSRIFGVSGKSSFKSFLFVCLFVFTLELI